MSNNINPKKAYASSFVSTLSENQNNISLGSSNTANTYAVKNSAIKEMK